MSLTVNFALVFHVSIAVAIMVMVCGRNGTGPMLQKLERLHHQHMTEQS